MKKSTKLLCGILSLGLLVTGCATVGNINNKEEDIVYNGNSAVMVDGHLYYGNAFVSNSDLKSDGDYKSKATEGYLARLNTQIELSAKNQDYSPKNVENVSNEIVSQEKSFMFALGNYIYYATPNRQEFSNDEGKPEKKYNYTTLYRSQLNGNKKKKLYTTKGEISQIEVLKFENEYYIVALAGSDLIKINIGSSKKLKADATVIAEDVKSVAIPKTYQKDKLGSSLDWNGQIYFTTAKTNENSSDVTGTNVNRVKINSNEVELMDAVSTTLTFVGREKDVVFFTNSVAGNDVYSYIADLTGDNNKYAITRNNKVELYQKAISNVSLLSARYSQSVQDEGYVFMVSNNLMRATKNGATYKVNSLAFMADSTVSSYKVLAVNGNTVYLGTTTAIYSADLTSGATSINCKKIVSMTAIFDGTNCAFDKDYVYFYAKLESVEKESEDDEEPETDDKYYLYRAKLAGSNDTEIKNYELLSKTTIQSRQSK